MPPALWATGRGRHSATISGHARNLPNVATGQFANGGGKYWTLNTRIAYTTGKYTMAFWGKNLTDKVYYPFGIAIENLFAESYRVRGEPRTLGVEATMRF